MPHKGTYAKPSYTDQSVYGKIKNRSRDIDEAVDVPEPTTTAAPKQQEYVPSTTKEKQFSDGTIRVWDEYSQSWIKKK